MLQKFRERARLNDVTLSPCFDLTLDQLLEKLNGKVTLRHAANLGEEIVREDGDIGLLETCGRKNVHNLVRNYCLGNDLPNREVQFLVRLSLAGNIFGEHSA